MPKDDNQPRGEAMFNAPLIVVIVALGLVVLHGLTYLMSETAYTRLVYDYALVPRRFWAPAGSDDAYPNLIAKLLTLLSTGFLHSGWLHVLVNAGMLLAFGAQVARILGGGIQGAGLWMLLYCVSVVAGSALYLALNGVEHGAAIGASGGVSGLIGAAFIAGFDGQEGGLFSRRFLTMTLAFGLANALLAVASPYLLGAGLAWQAHAGGYVAGALMMAMLLRRRAPAPQP